MNKKNRVGFAAYNAGQSRLEFYAKDGDNELLLAAFPFGSKKQEVEDFVNGMIDDHDLEIANIAAVMEDERYDEQFS